MKFDPKKMAVLVETAEQAQEVYKWYERNGYERHGITESYGYPAVISQRMVMPDRCSNYIPGDSSVLSREIVSYDKFIEYVGDGEKWVMWMGASNHHITQGNIYNVLKEVGNRYFVTDDLGKVNGAQLLKSFCDVVRAPLAVQGKKIVGFRNVNDDKIYPATESSSGNDIYYVEMDGKKVLADKAFLEMHFYRPVYGSFAEIIKLGSKGREFKVSKGKVEVKKECGGWEDVTIMVKLMDETFQSLLNGNLKVTEVSYKGEVFMLAEHLRLKELIKKINEQ